MVEDGGAVEQDGQRDGDEAGVVDADVLVDARERVGGVVGGGLLAGHAVLGGHDADEADLVVRESSQFVDLGAFWVRKGTLPRTL